jgi:glutamate carboxypeptidase
VSIVRPTPLVAAHELRALLAAVDSVSDEFLRDLRTLVDIDCGSYTKEGVDRVGAFVADAFAELGATVAIERDATLGDTVVGTFAGAGERRLLLIGHLDTVFDAGTVAERPFRIAGDRAYGPGVTDMKSGLLAGIYALRALRAVHAGDTWLPFARVVYIANPDEEIGSPVSTPIVRRHAAEADVCLVLECARANGDIVSSRKGVADLLVTIRGRAAHAGIEPEKGRSAIVEAAHKVIAIHDLNGRWPGVTVNVGVVTGGTRPNVVPEQALLEVDLRATDRVSMDEAETELRAIVERSTVPDVTATVEERHRHLPMEKLPRSGALVEHAVAIAADLGFELRDAATGGASDANTTAGMGVPTIDGLGPIGGHDHSPAEYLELDSIVPRVTLLGGLLLAISRDASLARPTGDVESA